MKSDILTRRRQAVEREAAAAIHALPACDVRQRSMHILALDLGTTTGWAVRADGAIASGTISFKPGRFEGGGMRFLRFRAWLAEVHASVGGIDALFFEEVRRHAGVDAAHVYGGFLAVLTAWAEQAAIPYAGVPVGTIKRHATGKGNADKAAMLAAMRAIGHAPADDNEADALALLHWAIEQATRAGMPGAAGATSPASTGAKATPNGKPGTNAVGVAT